MGKYCQQCLSELKGLTTNVRLEEFVCGFEFILTQVCIETMSPSWALTSHIF